MLKKTFLLSIFLYSGFIKCQNIDQFEKEIFISGNDTLNYRILKPKNYNSNKEVTLDWSDETLNINWKYKNPILSSKDSKGKAFGK